MLSIPGTYALILRASSAQLIGVGWLGDLAVRPGAYIYVGSALGAGGVAGRLRHHLGQPRAPHWHIDYLRPAARIDEVWWTCDDTRREHEWASAIAALPGAGIPLRRFGASDCRCPSHLFFFVSPPLFSDFVRQV